MIQYNRTQKDVTLQMVPTTVCLLQNKAPKWFFQFVNLKAMALKH